MSKKKQRLDEIKEKLYRTDEYGTTFQDPDARLPREDVEWLSETYDIKTDVHRTCINCQARQIAKYDGYVDGKGKKADKFSVPCSFIPRALPPGSREAIDKTVTETGMDRERATLVLKSTIDPVAWCELMFGFNDKTPDFRLRNYQKEQIRCSSRQLVIREGRRAGKSFAVSVKLLYLALNMEVKKGYDADGNEQITGPEIMVVTPFSAQVANLFDTMQKLLRRNPDLMSLVTSGTAGNLFVKTPFHRMTFSNGAIIKGFVSGVGSKEDGSGGGTIRGQDAHVIYLDEVDMIPDAIMKAAILPVRLTYAENVFITSSTPIGKRGHFYEWCNDSPRFKEDYLPSSVLPHWDAVKEECEAEGTDDTFAAEYLAKFVDGAHGLFPPQLVHEAKADYKYSQTRNPSWWKQNGIHHPENLIKVIGIDWNKNAGTEFCVIAFCPETGRWVVCETKNISQSEFSGRRWMDEVIRLNYKWKPDYIYADEGYGHTIIENLKLEAHQLRAKAKKTAEDMQTVHLTDRLVSFNFASRVTLKDPITGKDVSKPGKQFLIENAIRVVESGRLWFSYEDQQIVKEMINYTILRYSQAGMPVYGRENKAIGDHRLDAFVLALGGLFLERSNFSRKSFATSTPSFFDKDRLASRGAGENGEHPFTQIQKAGLGGPGSNMTVLEIMRGGNVPTEQGGPPIERRSRGGLPGSGPNQQTPYEYFTERASSSEGYSNDTEHLFKKPSTPKRISRRRAKPSRSFRSRMPGRKKR